MGSTSQGKEISLYRGDCGHNEKFIWVVRSLDKPQRSSSALKKNTYFTLWRRFRYFLCHPLGIWNFWTVDLWTLQKVPMGNTKLLPSPHSQSLLCWTLVLRSVLHKTILRKRTRLRNTIASCYRWSNVHLHIL